MELFTYFRSSAAYRVRIALNIKGLDYQARPIHLVKNEQRSPAYLEHNPLGLLPALKTSDGNMLLESLAIIEYLDEQYPEPSLLPGGAADRAYIRALAQMVACDIHPLNNVRVLQYLGSELKVDTEARNRWYRHWVMTGFEALEELLQRDSRTGAFCYGDQPTLADCALIPQVFNALRFECDISGLQTIKRITENCRQLDSFRRAAPDQQPDSE